MKFNQFFAATTLALLAWATTITARAAADQQETKSQHDARMAWWREARFGMFIHWGLYAIPEGEWNGKATYAEWIRDRAKIPLEEYDKLVGRFNPTNFDAARWATLAKQAGMKYIVITSKHHDGFCLWDSKLTDFDVMSTPFQRDILRELDDACRREGVQFGTYHSIMDWHHPDYLPRRPWEENRPSAGADFDRYVAYMKDQLKELVTRYQPRVMWFDGEWEDTWTHERGIDLFNYMRSLDPKLIVNNRVDKGRRSMMGMNKEGDFRGDFGTPEQQIPASGFGPGVDWESCMTMNAHWGWNKADEQWKSTEELVRKLVDVAGKGGNFLLNIGPKPDGTFPDEAIERLAGIGRWMEVNGEAIYGTGPTLFGAEAGVFSKTEKDKEGQPKFIPKWEWRCTTKPGKVYIHIFDWPATGRFELPGMKSRVTKAYLLADHSEVKFNQASNGVELTLPASAPDKIASVVCLEMAGVSAKLPNASATTPFAAAVEKDTRVQSHGSPWRFVKAPVTDPKLPRVLLVGDSILNGYLPYADTALKGKANVDAWVNPYHQSDDFNRWLAQALENGPYDVVHINTGLHGWQPGRIKEGTFEPLTKAMIEVIRQKCPDAKIIWASSTPILMKGKHELDPELNPIIVEHNRMAANVMEGMHVNVDDLYALMVGHLELGRGDQFHWTTPGSKLIAESVTLAISKALSVDEK